MMQGLQAPNSWSSFAARCGPALSLRSLSRACTTRRRMTDVLILTQPQTCADFESQDYGISAICFAVWGSFVVRAVHIEPSLASQQVRKHLFRTPTAKPPAPPNSKKAARTCLNCKHNKCSPAQMAKRKNHALACIGFRDRLRQEWRIE